MKHYLVHTLGAAAYKAHDQFSRKKMDFKCALWSVKYGTLFTFLIYVSVATQALTHYTLYA